jgi:ABC-2 type transport system ATP-binding protein
MDPDMIDCTGLAKGYGGTPVLAGLDLAVAPGEIYALLGPNGAGKTTTVRILATLIRADAGTARVAGADVVTERASVRRRIALTGQYAALDAVQTGRENLRMMAALAGFRGRAARRRADDLLARFDLVAAADRRVAGYSGGMRRRLDLAASLVARPAVIFLDEPTTGLDPRSRQELWLVVAELAREGTTVLLTTQYLEEADRLADRVAVLDQGRVTAEGTPAELKARVGGLRLELVARDATALTALAAAAAVAGDAVDPGARTVRVPVEDDAAEVRRILDRLDPDGTRIARFALHSASLDDVFLALTASKEPVRV